MTTALIIRTIIEGILVVLAIVGFANNKKLLRWENKMLAKWFFGEEWLKETEEEEN